MFEFRNSNELKHRPSSAALGSNTTPARKFRHVLSVLNTTRQSGPSRSTPKILKLPCTGGLLALSMRLQPFSVTTALPRTPLQVVESKAWTMTTLEPRCAETVAARKRRSWVFVRWW